MMEKATLVFLVVNAALFATVVVKLGSIQQDARDAMALVDEFKEPVLSGLHTVAAIRDVYTDAVTLLNPNGSVALLIDDFLGQDFSQLATDVTDTASSVHTATCPTPAPGPTPGPQVCESLATYDSCYGAMDSTGWGRPCYWCHSTDTTFKPMCLNGVQKYKLPAGSTCFHDQRQLASTKKGISKIAALVEDVSAKLALALKTQPSSSTDSSADTDALLPPLTGPHGLLLQTVAYADQWADTQLDAAAWQSVATKCVAMVEKLQAATWSGHYTGGCETPFNPKDQTWDASGWIADTLPQIRSICSIFEGLKDISEARAPGRADKDHDHHDTPSPTTAPNKLRPLSSDRAGHSTWHLFMHILSALAPTQP